MNSKKPDEIEEGYFEQMMDQQGVKTLNEKSSIKQGIDDNQQMLSDKFAGKPQVPETIKRKKVKLTQGMRPDDTLDLHGSTREEAIHKVQNFILTCRKYKYEIVLIITGKGLNSGQEGPVLKSAVSSWLIHNSKKSILDFRDAPANLGGSGAIIVFLKQ